MPIIINKVNIQGAYITIFSNIKVIKHTRGNYNGNVSVTPAKGG